MAIFHASTKPISRSAGRSAVAAIAYRTACRLVDERTGQVHDYTRKRGVVSTEILLPDGSSAERNALWNAAEAAEKRKDSRTAREWVIALPSELDAQQRQELAVGFAVELVTRYGVAVDLAIHLPDHEGDNRNHHAHLLTTTRQVSRDESGALVMGEKAQIEHGERTRRERGMIRGAEEITILRKLWEQTANQALKQAGRAERIDARSLKAQGIEREATQHLGPTASEMERRGKQTDRGDMNRQTAANNQERAQLVAQVIDLHEQRQHRDESRRVARNEAATARRRQSKEAHEKRRAELFAESVRELEASAKDWRSLMATTPQKPTQEPARPVQPVQAQPTPQKAAQTPQRAVPVPQIAPAVPAPQKPVQKPVQPAQAQPTPQKATPVPSRPAAPVPVRQAVPTVQAPQKPAAEPVRTYTAEEKDRLVLIVMGGVQQYRLGTITVKHETTRQILEGIAASPGTDKERMAVMRATLDGPKEATYCQVLHTAAWHVKPEIDRLARELEQERQRQQQHQQGPAIKPGGRGRG